MKRIVGVSTPLPGLTREVFAQYRENGIGAVEVSPAHSDFERLDLSAVAQDLRAEGIDTWSFHLRFCPFSLYSIALLDGEARAHAVAYAAEWIRRAAAEGFRYAIIHPSGEVIEDCDRQNAMQASGESLATLAEVARRAGIVLAVEDLPRTCLGRNSEELLTLLEADPALRVCFDTNHLLKEPPLAFLDAVGDRIVTTHFSDYDFIDERHWLPGDGSIDWRAMMHKLDEIGYRGVLMYETRRTVRNGEELPLAPQDYRRNADWLESL